jgi:two-component system sensor histidine kinase UhpB
MHTPRILLVEDSPDDAELIVCALRAGGLAFQHACIGSAAGFHAALASQSWDLVLTDYNLPAFSAREVVAAVRADPRDIPVIVVSGYVGEEEAVLLMKSGAADFIPKSSLARLLPALRREIREAQVRRSEREALQALREQERFLRDVTAAVGEGLVVLDEQGRVNFMNPEAERLLGWNEAELLGQNLHQIVHCLKADGSPNPHHDCPTHALQLDGDRCQADDQVYLRRDGQLLPVSLVATRITGRDGQVRYIKAFQDRTARLRAEKELEVSRRQLRELSAFLQQVREEERTHIARELHDELGQLLSGLSMDVDWLRRRLPAEDAPEAGKIAAMSRLIDDALRTVRRISTDLRPAVLDDLGLDAAIEWLVDGFHARTGIHCELRLDLEHIYLEERIATALFRLVQESLTNVVRHARADRVRISLHTEDDQLRLLIEDNGIGFQPDIHRPRSFGLLGMRERVLALSGRFSIDSWPGAGTVITALIPLAAGDC